MSDMLPSGKLAYSVREACEATSLGRSSIYKLIANGKLETRKVGNRTLIMAASLNALINGS
ncbi:helix-turn-helix domain-containing protein [Tsuneonella sp. CC-YZS046]|uniref:helix-turn-helix domain-containing protein n=1 Tax=Tsuneonella sp. CC-YZS046 TaxID=3042152 RepID=UPI002D77E844|nr:helix-turn-helix domain-containing protein [Tsuneonella sp. CC-YZS046]WRO65413.1 helix-turn-helix domain-containing protein [Tsuneonella sp. CC-YZS046]